MDSTNQYKERSFSLADGLTRRQAQKKLKNQLNHVQVMKNRIKVLTSQADYNKYRERYQAVKIQRHTQIHEELLKQKKQVQIACKSFDQSLSKKSANQRLNQEIKQKLNEAYAKIKQDKIQQSKEVKLNSRRNSQYLAKRKKMNVEQRRQMKLHVKMVEGEIRQSISRYNTQKKEDLKGIKILEKRSMCQLSQKVTKQLQQLNHREKQLIDLGSQSLQASRMRGRQYEQLFGKKTKGKTQLPGIASKAMDQSDTALTHD